MTPPFPNPGLMELAVFLQENDWSPSEEGGCPMKHFDDKHLNDLLRHCGVSAESLADIRAARTAGDAIAACRAHLLGKLRQDERYSVEARSCRLCGGRTSTVDGGELKSKSGCEEGTAACAIVDDARTPANLQQSNGGCKPDIEFVNNIEDLPNCCNRQERSAENVSGRRLQTREQTEQKASTTERESDSNRYRKRGLVSSPIMNTCIECPPRKRHLVTPANAPVTVEMVGVHERCREKSVVQNTSEAIEEPVMSRPEEIYDSKIIVDKPIDFYFTYRTLLNGLHNS